MAESRLECSISGFLFSDHCFVEWTFPPPVLITSSLSVVVLKCTGGHLIQLPLALAPCSTLFLLLSHALGPRYSTVARPGIGTGISETSKRVVIFVGLF